MKQQNCLSPCHEFVRMVFLLLTFMLTQQLFSLSTAEETCEKIDVCSCKFKNGSVVNLRPVDGGSKPRFTGIKGDSGRSFDWNPCTPFDTHATEPGPKKQGYCTDTMVCQVAGDGDRNAGSKDTTFSVENGNVVVAYGAQAGFDQTKRKSRITLKCDPSQPGNGTIPQFTEVEKALYHATFTSKFACPKRGRAEGGGLSTGSILLIIFFCLLFMYIIVGILLNHYAWGVKSVPEILPNHSFWADFPFLVKDGVVFTYGGVKSACSSLSRKCGKDGYAEI
ncbi:cation-dependent mannose-6-phosphate receptor-like [Montipora foliosa]|uniref:cation-dependent mannose-6-phosphate receptor-like n=1 Tax=Montipora foliosa TaxID=591990 RepID=UPI0035F17256